MLTKSIDLMTIERMKHIGSDAQGITDQFGIELPLVLLLGKIFEYLANDGERIKFFTQIPISIGLDNKDVSLVKYARL
jgi:hypothetical protein